MRALIVVLAVPLMACGGGNRSGQQHVRVVTDPPGAACTLHRGHQELARIEATPAVVPIRAAPNRPLQLRCSFPGHTPARMEMLPGSAPVVLASEPPPPQPPPRRRARPASPPLTVVAFNVTDWTPTLASPPRYDTDVTRYRPRVAGLGPGCIPGVDLCADAHAKAENLGHRPWWAD